MDLSLVQQVRHLADGSRSVSKISKLLGVPLEDVQQVVKEYALAVAWTDSNQQVDRRQLTDEEFVIAAKRGWALLRDHNPSKMMLVKGRLDKTSGLYVSGCKSGFLRSVADEFWEFESDPRIFKFLQADWRKARDLMLLAAVL